MKPATGYYSLVQYCPDHARLEAANIGVLLFCPEPKFLRAKLSESDHRIRRFFPEPKPDHRRVSAIKQAIIDRLESEPERFQTVQDLQHFIATRANDILLTDPRPMKVLDPEQDLTRLFAKLVGGRERRARRQPVVPELDAAFQRDTLRNRILFNREVEIPIVGKTLKVPYAYRNGTLNLIKPHAFTEDRNEATSTAMRLAIEGDLLGRHADDPSKLIVVARFAPGLDGTRESINDLFNKYSVRLVRQEQVVAFVREVEAEARPIQQS